MRVKTAVAQNEDKLGELEREKCIAAAVLSVYGGGGRAQKWVGRRTDPRAECRLSVPGKDCRETNTRRAQIVCLRQTFVDFIWIFLLHARLVALGRRKPMQN